MSQQPSIGRIVHYTTVGDPAYAPSRVLTAMITGIFDEVPPLGGQGETVLELVRSGQPQHAKVLSSRVELCVIYPLDTLMDPGSATVPYSETPKPGHWSWPPRVGGGA